MPSRFKPSKYRAVKTVLGGIRFDSKKEARRWQELEALENAGKIAFLKRQVSIPLVVSKKRICVYRADFTYVEDGQVIIEDAKGYQTDIFKLKWKMAQVLYPDWRFRLS